MFIYLYGSHFKVQLEKGEHNVHTHMRTFIKQHLGEYDYINRTKGQPTHVADWLFYKPQDVYYIHSHYYRLFIGSVINNYGYNPVIKEVAPYKYVSVKHTLTEGFKPRSYQEDVLSWIDDKAEYVTVIQLSCGLGKTFTSLFSVQKYGGRLIVITKSSYLEQWEADIRSIYVNPIIERITGTAKLLKLFKNGEVADITLISIETYRSYLNAYVVGRHAVDPTKLWKKLSASNLIIDEGHSNLHANSLLMSTARPKRILVLTATIKTKNPFRRKMQSILYPITNRKSSSAPPYIDYATVSYHITYPDTMRTSEFGRTNYSHIAYERWLTTNTQRANNYYKMITSMLKNLYIKRRKEGEKVMVLLSLKNSVKELSIYLSKHLPDERVIDFTGATKQEEIYDKTIILSSNIKAGTAIDIPGLIVLVQTINVASLEMTDQNIGRLRPPSNGVINKKGLPEGYIDDSERAFVQLNCEQIPKHKQYQEERDLNIRHYLINKQYNTYNYQQGI